MPAALGVYNPFAKKTPAAAKLPAMPGLPAFMGGGSAAKPLTTVVNGKAGSYVNGKFVPQGQEGGGGAATPAAASAMPGAPGTLTNTAQKDPNVQNMMSQYQDQLSTIKGKSGATDPNQQFLIDQYKGRLGTDQTQRLMDRAAGATRDVQGAQRGMLDRMSSTRGGGAGAGAVQQGDAAVRAMAKAGSDIQLADQARKDALVMGGSGIMNAPGQRELSYDQMATNLTNANPAIQAANLGIAQQGLGLQQYSAQNQAQVQQQQLQQQQQQMQQQQQQQQLQAWMEMLRTYQSMS